MITDDDVRRTEISVSATPKDQTPSGNLNSILVTYDTRIDRKNSKASLKPLSWVVEQIRSSEDLKKKVTLVRAEASVERRRELKKKLLPYFTFLHFENGMRKSDFFQDARYILMDIDHVADKLDLVREKLRKDPEVFIYFQSPSGDGFKVVFALDQDITTESHYKKIYQRFRALVKERYGVVADDSKDVARACFLSYDPDLYVNLNAQLLPAEPELVQPEEEAALKPVVRIKAALEGVDPGARTNSMSTIIGLYVKKGFDKSFALDFIRVWNRQNNPPLSDAKLVETVNDEYRRYDNALKTLPVKFFVSNDQYFKKVVTPKGSYDSIVTSFIIKPKELLVLDDTDCLVCDIKSTQGYEYPGVLIESTDWHSRQKFLKAVGHQDCVFLGSDNDLQALCVFISTQVPVRKTGTRVIGLNQNVWVTEGLNITAKGISFEPTIVPYDKGNGAFYHKISYGNLPEAEYTALATGLCTDLLDINEQKVILPLLGWFFAAPVKEIVRSIIGAFPSVLIHGGQGSGKTSTAKMFMRLAGYKNAVPSKCDMKPFPMLKNLSSTNGIPQFYDEFKQSDMKDDVVDSLLRYIREIYDGELEQKGREDQTTVEYELLAPMAVLGEWNISQPAVRERVLMIRFTDAVKRNKKIRESFKRVMDLPLDGFMPRYIQFCLNQDIPGILGTTRKYVEEHFESKNVAPRILNNLAVMFLGLVLFQEFAVECGVKMPRIEPEDFLDDQLREITGTDAGQVRSSVDQLIQELGFMWQKNEKQITSSSPAFEPTVKQVPWWTTADVDKRKVIAIRFNKVFPEFKEYAQRTKYEGDLLDKESYLRLFKECDYIVSSSHPVDFDGKKQRCLCIDVEKAVEAGLDLEGFGVTDVTS
jgi:hypothetical protein